MDTTHSGGAVVRSRGDRCPGVFRPWPAEDGLLVRLRLVGGLLSGDQLAALLEVSERFGDGNVHLTGRANLQVRGLPGPDSLTEEIVRAFEATGLVPSRGHELVRNIVVSPQSGYAGGRADLRPVAGELDRLLVADPALAGLPGRFLFVLDDGRGDVVGTPTDLGLAALDAERVQVRIGDGWGPIVDIGAAPVVLTRLARDFLAARGSGPRAAWHVRELGTPLVPSSAASADLAPPVPSLAYGPVGGGVHAAVPGGVLTADMAESLLDEPTLIVTPWRGIFVPSPRGVAKESS